MKEIIVEGAFIDALEKAIELTGSPHAEYMLQMTENLNSSTPTYVRKAMAERRYEVGTVGGDYLLIENIGERKYRVAYIEKKG